MEEYSAILNQMAVNATPTVKIAELEAAYERGDAAAKRKLFLALAMQLVTLNTIANHSLG